MSGNRELFRGVNNKKDCYFCYTPWRTSKYRQEYEKKK